MKVPLSSCIRFADIGYKNVSISKYPHRDRVVRFTPLQNVKTENKKIRVYREYLFDADPNYVLDRTYAENLLGDGTIWEPIGKLRKH